jgi:hypothetical protein
LVVSKNKYALLSRVNSYRELLPSITVDQGEKQLWLASNTRATNLYKDRELCLYLINVYPNVGVQHYLTDYLEPIDKDKYALSEMLQFIWRGCVRDNKPMKLYIASARMKGLFKDWLEST